MNYAIIVAGGTGSRITSAALPKQFLTIGNKPVVAHTIDAFFKADPEISIVIPVLQNWQAHLSQIIETYFSGRNIKIVAGGETRYHSVKNALLIVDRNSVVAIHDAVRPLASSNLIKNALENAFTNGSAIPVIPVTDSIRQKINNTFSAVDRSQYFLVQTPQCFRYGLIAEAYENKYNPSFTDDASVAEAAGISLNFIQGEKNNLKITFEEDLRLAEALLSTA